MDDTLSMLAHRLRRTVPHHSMALWVRRGDVLIPAFTQGDESRLFAALEIPMGQGLSGWVAENLKPIVNGNPSVESSYQGDASRISALRSAMAVPLEGLNGMTGVLTLYHADRDAFSKQNLRLLQAVSAKIAMSLEGTADPGKTAVAPKEEFAKGVLNAGELFQRLDGDLWRARQDNAPLTLVVMNVEGSQQIDARFGQIEGARALREFALGVKSLCREYDTVANMGGDEFVVLLYGVRPEETISRLAQFRSLLADLCRERYAKDLLTLSMGTASYPSDGEDQEALLAQADRRMYSEKREQQANGAMPPKPAAGESFLSHAIH
jgi:diguanylate cyclase (GGDEF)-like protein